MFQLESFTEARVTSVTNRQEAHGDEKVPAVTIGLEITAANTLLDLIDPNLRHAIYKVVEYQEHLPDVEVTTPVLRCNSFGLIQLTTAHEGWALHVDDSFDESDPMEFSGVKIDNFRVDAKQGGSIVLKLRAGTSDVDADRLGKLGMHNGQSIWIKVLAPKRSDAPVIDGTVAAFKADHPEASAGDLFAAQHRGREDEAGPDDDTDDEGAATDAYAQSHQHCPLSGRRK